MHPLFHPNQHVIIITPPPVGGTMDAFIAHTYEGEPPDEVPEEIGWVIAPNADQAVAAVRRLPWAGQLWGTISVVPRRRDAIGHALLKPLTADVAPRPSRRASHPMAER